VITIKDLKVIPEGYNFKGGLKSGSKPGWIAKMKIVNGKQFALPKEPTQEYVNTLSCVTSVAVKGLSKRAMTWEVPSLKTPLYFEQVGMKKLSDGQKLPLFILTETKPKA